MGLQQLSYNVSEAVSSLTVCADLIGQTERSILVDIVTVQETAQGKNRLLSLFVRNPRLCIYYSAFFSCSS